MRHHLQAFLLALLCTSTATAQRDPLVNFFPDGSFETSAGVTGWLHGRTVTLDTTQANIGGSGTSTALRATTTADAGSLSSPAFNVQLSTPGSGGLTLRMNLAATEGDGLMIVRLIDLTNGRQAMQSNFNLVEARTGFRYVFRSSLGFGVSPTQFRIDIEWTNTTSRNPLTLLIDDIEVHRGHDLRLDITPQVAALTTAVSMSSSGVHFTPQGFVVAVDVPGRPALLSQPVSLWALGRGWLYLDAFPGALWVWLDGPTLQFGRGAIPGLAGTPIYVQPFATDPHGVSYAGEWRSFTVL